jgi:hypothetical protein
LDTDRLIARLGAEHQDALRATFCWTGPLHDRARSLEICASTLNNRTRAAMFRLDDLYHARRPVAHNRITAT